MTRALKKITKAQKKQAQELRLEIDFLERIARKKHPIFTLMGKQYWCAMYLVAIYKYSQIYKQQVESGHDIWSF